MGLFSFIRDAGEKLFNRGQDAHAATVQSSSAAGSGGGATAAPDPSKANAVAAKAIRDYIAASGLDASGLNVDYDGAARKVVLEGQAADQATREKMILLAGNVDGVEQVDDRISVPQGQSASRFYTVKSGDTLSKIAKEHYGDASKYQSIFEANRPMLKDPDRIYPGQSLRIPEVGQA